MISYDIAWVYIHAFVFEPIFELVANVDSAVVILIFREDLWVPHQAELYVVKGLLCQYVTDLL